MWGIRPDSYYCQTVAALLKWGALSDERTGLSFTIAAGPRQRSHSLVRVPWNSRPYFTVSDSRLPFSSPPTTRRVTVKVCDPTSARDSYDWLREILERPPQKTPLPLLLLVDPLLQRCSPDRCVTTRTARTTENAALLLFRAFASTGMFAELLPSNELFRPSGVMSHSL
jgi:hypothetical protein